MRVHLPVLNHGVMDPAPRPVRDPDQRPPRRHGPVGVAALVSRWHGAHTVLSALYGVLAEIEALGLHLLEIRQLTPERQYPESGNSRSP